jgi:predicted nucleic acid-binding protein
VNFLDTNILIYAHDKSAAEKRYTAGDLVRRLTEDGDGALSIQVLAEFYAVTTGKGILSEQEAGDVVEDFGIWTVHSPSHADILRAIHVRRRYGISWWDALILNSAIELGCHTLWTEDLNDGQQYGPVTVRNPFIAA